MDHPAAECRTGLRGADQVNNRRNDMDIMKQLTPIYGILTPEELLKDNTYPGRGIVIGKTPTMSVYKDSTT
jgi:hypothetical protein